MTVKGDIIVKPETKDGEVNGIKANVAHAQNLSYSYSDALSSEKQ